MNIVLASTPLAENPWNTRSFPPLGLLYVAGGLKDLENVHVKIVDAFGEGLNVKESVERILANSPDILGLNVTSRNVDEAAKLLTELKALRPGLVTVAGGIHPTLFDTLMLKEIDALDFVIRGEGDESFGALCRNFRTQEPLADIQGVSYRFNGNVISGQPVEVADLNKLPFPDRSLLDFDGYGYQWYGYEFPDMPPLTTAVSSRGCPFNCLFCADTKFCGRRYRIRSAENVVAELLLLSRQGFEFVIFWDDNLVYDVNRLEKLCTMIRESNLNLRLACAGTFHKVPQRVMDLMHEAGFDIMFVGVESGSPAQLKRYQKPASRQELAGGIRRAKKAHIVTVASFVNGAPGETEGDFNNTKNFLREVRPHLADINPLMVHPGSQLWDQLNKSKTITTLADTHSFAIWRYPNQHDKQTVLGREKDFRSTFGKTWFGWRRFMELINLLFHNPTVRMVFKGIPKRPKSLLKFLKGINPR